MTEAPHFIPNNDEKTTERMVPKTDLGDVEPIERTRGLQINSTEDLETIIEPPLLKCAQILFSKGIDTYESSANKANLEWNIPVGIGIINDNLSPENAAIIEELTKEDVSERGYTVDLVDSTNYSPYQKIAYLRIPVHQGLTVKEIEEKSVDFANRLKPNKELPDGEQEENKKHEHSKHEEDFVPENFLQLQLNYEYQILTLNGDTTKDNLEEIDTLVVKIDQAKLSNFKNNEYFLSEKNKITLKKDKISGELNDKHQLIQNIESLRQKNQKFGFNILQVLKPQDLWLDKNIASLYNRTFNRSATIGAISNEVESYLHILRSDIERLSIQLKELNRAEENTLNDLRLCEQVKLALETNDVGPIDKIIVEMTNQYNANALAQRIGSNSWATSSPQYPSSPLNLLSIKGGIDRLTQYSQLLNEYNRKVSELTFNVEKCIIYSFGTIKNLLKDRYFITDHFPYDIHRQNILSIREKLISSGKIDRLSIEKATNASLSELETVTLLYQEKIAERDNYRQTRELNKGTVQTLLSQEQLSSTDQEKLRTIIEQYPFQGVDYMSTEEYLELIHGYSHGLAFHTSSLFTKFSGSDDWFNEQEGATKFWGAIRLNAIIPYLILQLRGLDSVSNAAGSAAIHFAINTLNNYSNVGIADNVGIIAVAPVELLAESGRLYSSGFDSIDQSNNLVKPKNDQEISGFYTETNNNEHHPSNELPLCKFILIMPEGCWIDPSKQQSGVNNLNLPDGALSAKEFFDRVNSRRRRANLPEFKVVFSSQNNTEHTDTKSDNMIVHWLKQEELYNSGYHLDPKNDRNLVSLHPSRESNPTPRYQVHIPRQRYGTIANNYYWHDYDPKFDELIGKARQRIRASRLQKAGKSNQK